VSGAEVQRGGGKVQRGVMEKWYRGCECRGGARWCLGAEVVLKFRGAEVVQWWCSGGAEMVHLEVHAGAEMQMCRSAEVQRWCRGGAEVVQKCKIQGARMQRGCNINFIVYQWCRGAPICILCKPITTYPSSSAVC